MQLNTGSLALTTPELKGPWQGWLLKMRGQLQRLWWVHMCTRSDCLLVSEREALRMFVTCMASLTACLTPLNIHAASQHPRDGILSGLDHAFYQGDLLLIPPRFRYSVCHTEHIASMSACALRLLLHKQCVDTDGIRAGANTLGPAASSPHPHAAAPW